MEGRFFSQGAQFLGKAQARVTHHNHIGSSIQFRGQRENDLQEPDDEKVEMAGSGGAELDAEKGSRK